MSVFDLQDPISQSFIVKKDGTACIPELRRSLRKTALTAEDVHPFCGMNGTFTLLYIVNLQPIQFNGCKGLRYLIEGALGNEKSMFLFYIFQGLSDDNRYFIYLFYEGVTNSYSYPPAFLEDEQTRTAFNERMRKILDLGWAPLVPPLEVLDAMMTSIEIK